MTERDAMEQLRKRAETIIDDVLKAQPEEAKRRVLLGRVNDQLVMAYNMGVVDTEGRIYGAPWEYRTDAINEELLNERASEGRWEPFMTFGNDNRCMIFRRRKFEEVKR